MKLAKHTIDIAVLSETSLHASDSPIVKDLGYTLYWSGKPTDESIEAGEGFAIK